MKRLFSILVCTLFIAGSVNALTVSSVDGTWSNVVGGEYPLLRPPVGIAYGNTLEDQVRWGDPAGSTDPGLPVEDKSGLGFTGIADNSVVDVDDVFEVGLLQHYNRVVAIDTAAEEVTLTISLSFTDPPSWTTELSFTLLIDETPNAGGPPSSDDIISFVSNLPDVRTFESGGVVYELRLLGFGPSSDNPITEFVSPEGGISQTKLWGQITMVPSEPKVDIKPTSCPNPLNVNSNGVLPVAILGTAAYDVMQVDPGSIQLEGFSPLRWSYEDVAGPVGPDAEECECTTAGPDGHLDLTLKFDKQDIIDWIGDVEDGQYLPLTLTWNLLDGTPQEGSDCVVIRKKGKKGKK